jgi:hypothetical protein
MGVEEGWSSPALHAQLVRDSSRTRPAMSSQLPRRRRWGGITAHLRIPIRPRTAINDPLSNCVVDVVPDEPSCLHAWRSPSRRLMKRTGSAKASSGDSLGSGLAEGGDYRHVVSQTACSFLHYCDRLARKAPEDRKWKAVMVLRGARLDRRGAQVGSWGSLGSRGSLYFVFTREKERSGQVL